MLPEHLQKGMHGTCDVMRVKADNVDGFTEINAHDFDSTVHVAVGEASLASFSIPATPLFEKMTKAELQEYLGAKGVPSDSGLTKAELVALCEQHA